MLNKLLTDQAMRRHGMADPYEEHRDRPLAEHLIDFGKALASRTNSTAYCKLVIGRLRALLAGCGWRTLDDLTASQAEEWLAGLRASSRQVVVLPEGKEAYRPCDAAKLLGTSLANVRAMVKRHGLEATGQGKARRFPRAAMQALVERQEQGASVQTTNAYMTHLKTFGNWLVRDRRLGENPFRHMQGANTKIDRRHDRRVSPRRHFSIWSRSRLACREQHRKDRVR